MLPYLNSELQNASDELIYGVKCDMVTDARLKGKIQAIQAVIDLPFYLYSVEVKKESDSSGDTTVDDE